MKRTVKNKSLTEHLVLEFKTKLTILIAFLISMNFNILETGGGWGWGCIEVFRKSPEGLTRISTHKVVKLIRTACLNILNGFLPPSSYRLHVWDCSSARYAPGRKVAGAQCRTSSAVSVVTLRWQLTNLLSLRFKFLCKASHCYFFLSRCESKELDAEIRNLIEKSSTFTSHEDPEPVAQESPNHQRASCSLKVNTDSFCNCLSVRGEHPGNIPCVTWLCRIFFFLISEMINWICNVFFWY